MKHFFPVVILVLFSCCDNEPLDPSFNPIELSVIDINKLFKNNPEANRNSLELEVLKIFKAHGLKTVTDDRLIKILTNLREEGLTGSHSGTSMRVAAPCSGSLLSFETADADEDDGEWIGVWRYKDGSTYYRWYDANNKVIDSGCIPAPSQS